MRAQGQQCCRRLVNLVPAHLGPTWLEADGNEKRRGADHKGPHPARLFFHQRRQLREYTGHPAPELFIVPLEPGDLLRVHAEGVGMDGYLIEIVGAPPL